MFLDSDDPFLARVDHLLAVGDAVMRRDEDWGDQFEAYRQRWLMSEEDKRREADEAFRRDESRPRIQRFPTRMEMHQ